MATNVWLGTTSTDPTVTTNWLTGAVPTSGDTVILDFNAVNNLAPSGANQSSIVLANLIINQSFLANGFTVGGPTVAGVPEPWQIGAALFTIGANPPAGQQAQAASGRINIDFGTSNFVGTIVNTPSTSADANLAPVRVKGINSSSQLVILSGTAAVAGSSATEVANIGTIDVNGGTLTTNTLATLTTINVASGQLVTNSGMTTLNAPGGQIVTQGTGSITTVNIGGTANLNHRPASGAMITNLNVYSNGTADFTGNPLPGTVTNRTVYEQSNVKVPISGGITFTNQEVLAGGASQASYS